MKKNHYPTLITLSFFAGMFLMVFTTEDLDVAAVRFVVYLFLSCSLALGVLYKNQLKEFYDKAREYMQTASAPSSKIDSVLTDAHKFSEEYGEVYVLADKLKQQKKGKNIIAVSGKK